MANELTLANMADALVSEQVTGGFEVKAHESGNFLNHPVIQAGYLGSVTGMSSNVISRVVAGVAGSDPLAATNEGTAPAYTQLFLDKVTATVTKHSKIYGEMSDIVQLLIAGRLPISVFVQDAFLSYQSALMDSLCAEIDGFSSPVGSALTQMDAPTVIAAMTAAKVAKLRGPLMLMQHEYQWGQLAMDLGLGTGGVLQWIPATQEMVALKTDAYQGNWLGLDVYVSSRVVTGDAGASRVGAILGTFPLDGGGNGSSVVWADADWLTALPTQIIVGGKVLFGLDREEKAGETNYVSHANFGTGPGQAGISVKSINAAPS